VLPIGVPRRLAAAEGRPGSSGVDWAWHRLFRRTGRAHNRSHHRWWRCTGRHPLAAIEDHPAQLTTVGNDGQEHAAPLRCECVAAWCGARLRAGSVVQSYFIAARSPHAGHRWPSSSFEREGAGCIEVERERAHDERARGQARLCRSHTGYCRNREGDCQYQLRRRMRGGPWCRWRYSDMLACYTSGFPSGVLMRRFAFGAAVFWRSRRSPIPHRSTARRRRCRHVPQLPPGRSAAAPGSRPVLCLLP
jgi:hypothetical protein